MLAAIILFLPSSTLNKMGLSQIHNEYLGIWWILFIFTGALWIGQFASGIKNWWRKKAKERRKFNILKERMLSLSEPEKNWVRYCLYYGEQTAVAPINASVPQSLVNKRILRQGTGHLLKLPFHFDDDAWNVAQANISEFLSPEEFGDPAVGKRLDEFMRRLR